jgi:hypothetical protein
MLLGLACLTALESGSAQVRAANPERLLAERFGFTPGDIAQARSGKAVAKLLPSTDSAEIGVIAAVHIAADPERLTVWLKDVASFRKAAELGLSRRLNDPPQIGDFADLSLDAAELAELRACRPGNCDLRLGDRALQRFQTEVDWTAADAPRRANLLTRQLMLSLAEAYAKGGDEALGEYHNEKTPRSAAEDFRLVLGRSSAIYDLTPALANYLWRFPNATLPGSEQFLYWAKGGVGPEASMTLHQLITWREPGGSVLVIDKQLFASRYADAGLLVFWSVPMPDGAGFYAIAGARARAGSLEGTMARVLRGRVEKATRETVEMYLNWIRDSLSIAVR